MILYLKHLHRSLEQEKIQKSLDLKNLLSEKEIEAKIREALDMPAE